MTTKQNAPVYIFLGQIGAGKTVQAQALSGVLDATHLSIGSLIRKHHSNDPRVHKGELLPDDFVNQVVDQEFSDILPARTVILDGYPRKLAQKQWLDQYLTGSNRVLANVVHICVDEEELITRLTKRGRDDDNPTAIKTRMNVFNNEVLPVIEAYKDEGRVTEIDGMGSKEEVFTRIKKALRL